MSDRFDLSCETTLRKLSERIKKSYVSKGGIGDPNDCAQEILVHLLSGKGQHSTVDQMVIDFLRKDQGSFSTNRRPPADALLYVHRARQSQPDDPDEDPNDVAFAIQSIRKMDETELADFIPLGFRIEDYLEGRDLEVYRAYAAGTMLKEIGQTLDLTESRVSQLLANAVSKAKKRIAEGRKIMDERNGSTEKLIPLSRKHPNFWLPESPALRGLMTATDVARKAGVNAMAIHALIKNDLVECEEWHGWKWFTPAEADRIAAARKSHGFNWFKALSGKPIPEKKPAGAASLQVLHEAPVAAPAAPAGNVLAMKALKRARELDKAGRDRSALDLLWFAIDELGLVPFGTKNSTEKSGGGDHETPRAAASGF